MTAAWHPPAYARRRPRRCRDMSRKVRERRLRASWRRTRNQELAAKPLRDKFSELFGSMLTAAMFAALAALVAPVVLGVATNSASMAVYLWLALVGTLGSWAIIVPTKFTEGKLEDQGPIRIVLLALGGLVGAAAWFLAEALIVQVPGGSEPLDANWGLISHEWLQLERPAERRQPVARRCT